MYALETPRQDPAVWSFGSCSVGYNATTARDVAKERSDKQSESAWLPSKRLDPVPCDPLFYIAKTMLLFHSLIPLAVPEAVLRPHAFLHSLKLTRSSTLHRNIFHRI